MNGTAIVGIPRESHVLDDLSRGEHAGDLVEAVTNGQRDDDGGQKNEDQEAKDGEVDEKDKAGIVGGE